VSDADGPRPDVEWDFLTYDIDAVCSECGGAIRPAQAVGHIGSQTIHAKCFRGEAAA